MKSNVKLEISDLVYYKLGPLLDLCEVEYLKFLPRIIFFEEILDALVLHFDTYDYVKHEALFMVDLVLSDKYSDDLYHTWKRYLNSFTN